MLEVLPPTIPPAPWTTNGAALIIVGRLGRQRAHQLAGRPRGFLSLPFLGSMAALGFVRYDETPVGSYHEMMLCPGLIWHDVPAGIISHLPVDSPRSLLGGRAIWGLPKVLAGFQWQDGEIPEVRLCDTQGTQLVRATFHRRSAFPGLFMPPIPLVSVRGPRIQLFTISGSLRQVTRMHAELEIAPASDYAPLSTLLHGPYLALQAESFHMRISRPLDLL